MAAQPNRSGMRLRGTRYRVRRHDAAPILTTDRDIRIDHRRTPTMPPPSGDDQTNAPDIEADRQADAQADAMKDQLRKDVASWSAARSAETSDLGARPATTPAKPTAAARAPRQKAKAAEPAKPVETVKKPFRMSYDGTTDKDYIAQRIKLGAR